MTIDIERALRTNMERAENKEKGEREREWEERVKRTIGRIWLMQTLSDDMD